MKPLKIYVAGPLSNDDKVIQNRNIDFAVSAGRVIAEMGHYPFVPHLNEVFDDGNDPLDYEYWLKCDMAYLRCCDAMLFLGASPGALRELYFAGQHMIPVYWNVDEIPGVGQ